MNNYGVRRVEKKAATPWLILSYGIKRTILKEKVPMETTRFWTTTKILFQVHLLNKIKTMSLHFFEGSFIELCGSLLHAIIKTSTGN